MIRGTRAGWLAPAVALWLAGCTPERGSDPAADAALPPSPRIVTLAPHLAELAHAAGAGRHLVGVSAYSNYPDEVLALPQIGDAFGMDQEQLALLRPDLLLAWQSGTPAHTVDELRKLGYRVEVLRTRTLADVADALREIGRLASTADVADEVADRFLNELDRLRLLHADSEPIRVFYQVSARPLYTVNGTHYLSELIGLCGGQNVFADLGELAPLVSVEAVLARDPELMLAGRTDGRENLFADWLRWPEMAANRFDNRFYIDADLLSRATPRLVRTAVAICTWLQEGRRNRGASTGR